MTQRAGHDQYAWTCRHSTYDIFEVKSRHHQQTADKITNRIRRTRETEKNIHKYVRSLDCFFDRQTTRKASLHFYFFWAMFLSRKHCNASSAQERPATVLPQQLAAEQVRPRPFSVHVCVAGDTSTTTNCVFFPLLALRKPAGHETDRLVQRFCHQRNI